MDNAAVDRRRSFRSLLCSLVPCAGAGALAALLGGCAAGGDTGVVKGDTRNQIIISVRDQKLTVVQPDHHRVTFPISTSKYGFGDRRGSYATPLGELEVAQKYGGGAPAGSVFHGRVRTGEIVGIDAPGRDAIVTRILALRGLEAGNRDAYARGIYIHGTPEERNIGRPSSYGCIRMRSRDVIALYNMVNVGAKVQIIDTTMPQAIASNIVTPPPAPPTAPPAPAGAPPAASPVINPTAVAANATKADTATAKALNTAAAANTYTAPIGTVSAPVKPPPNAVLVAQQTTPPAPAAKPAASAAPASGKQEWAGSPAKLLAKANEAEAREKNGSKPAGATRGSATPQPRPASNDNSQKMNRSALDSL